MPGCFLTKDKNDVGLEGRGGGKGQGDIEGRETISRIYCIREKNLFSI